MAVACGAEQLDLSLGAVDDAAMLDHDALWLTCGARGVDDVGEMGRGEPEVVGVEVVGVGRGRVGGLSRWQGLVELDDGDSAGCVQSEGSESDGVREQSAGLSVGEKLSESLDGVGGVE